MVGFLDNPQSQPPPALYQAFKVLQFLAQAGNQAAERRLHDITQSCLHVWPDHVFSASTSPNSSVLVEKTPTLRARADSRQNPLLTPSDPPPYMAMSFGRDGHRDEGRLLEPLSNMDIPDAMFDMQGEWDLDLSGEAEGIYSSFHNPTLPLTGVDYIDWLEIEKIISAP
jgi:proline utilization trans-activator